MSLASQVSALATRIATEIKAVRAEVATKAGLTDGKDIQLSADLTNEYYGPLPDRVAMSPFGPLWHDLLSFANATGQVGMTFEVTTDGTTWGAPAGWVADAALSLFTGKDNGWCQVVDGTTTTGARFTFDPLSWTQGRWLILGHGWSDPNPSKRVHVESSNDGTTWVTRHDTTYSDTAAPVWHYVSDFAGAAKVRVTITHLSGSDIVLTTMRLLTARWGDQGLGRENSSPFVWNAARNIGLGYPESEANNLTQRLHVAGDSQQDGLRLRGSDGVGRRLSSSGSDGVLSFDGQNLVTDYAVRSVSADTTAVVGELLRVDATAGTVTVTPPSSPATGSRVLLTKTDASGNAVVWAGTVDGDTEGAQLVTPATATFVWDGTMWLVESTNLGVGVTDTFADAATRTRAQRFSRRTRAEVDALLGEVLPTSSLSTVQTYATSNITTPGTAQSIVSNAPNPVFRVSGGTPVQVGGTYPDSVSMKTTGLDSTFGGLTMTLEFTYTGSQFEVVYKWVAPGNIRVWADGVVVGTQATPVGTPDGGFRKHLVTLPDARQRQIRVDISPNLYFIELTIQPSTTVSYPANKPKGPRCILFGDSYVEGSGSSNAFNTLGAQLSTAMGWVDTWVSGSGGTGYLSVPVSPAGRKTLRGRAATDVIAPAPNVVIVAAGLNDRVSTATDVAAEADLLYAQIASGLPDAEVIVVGSWGPRDYSLAPTVALDINAALKAKAAARGWYFIDPINERWITGTGYVGATNGTGNSDTYIGADATHPTDAGHRYLAQRLAGHLRTLGMTPT